MTNVGVSVPACESIWCCCMEKGGHGGTKQKGEWEFERTLLLFFLRFQNIQCCFHRNVIHIAVCLLAPLPCREIGLGYVPSTC